MVSIRFLVLLIYLGLYYCLFLFEWSFFFFAGGNLFVLVKGVVDLGLLKSLGMKVEEVLIICL